MCFLLLPMHVNEQNVIYRINVCVIMDLTVIFKFQVSSF